MLTNTNIDDNLVLWKMDFVHRFIDLVWLNYFFKRTFWYCRLKMKEAYNQNGNYKATSHRNICATTMVLYTYKVCLDVSTLALSFSYKDTNTTKHKQINTTIVTFNFMKEVELNHLKKKQKVYTIYEPSSNFYHYG